MRKLFRILIAIPCWLFLQSVGILMFTIFGIVLFLGIGAGVAYMVSYLGTGNKNDLSESVEAFSMAFLSLFGGTLVTWSWIQTGDFDMDNLGLTHLQKEEV